MKILYIGMDNTNYGSRSHEIRVAELMAKRGYDVTLCCERMPNFEGDPIPKTLDIHAMPVDKLRISGLLRGLIERLRRKKELGTYIMSVNKGLRRGGFRLVRGLIEGLQREKKFDELVEKLQKEKKFDIIFGSSISATDISIKLGRKFNIPVLSQVLDIPIWQLHPYKIWNEHFRIWRYWLKYLVLSDKIVVNNEVTKRDLIDFAKELDLIKNSDLDISVIPYGINTLTFDRIPAQKELDQMIFASRLVLYKGLDLLIEAMSLVKNPPKLIVVGNGAERQKLEKSAKDKNVDCNFLGAIPDKDKIREIKKSKFMVYPSITDHIAGLPPIEALYCKKPCICFDIKIIHDLYEDHVEYVPRGDINLLAEKIGSLNTDENYRKKRGANGRDFVKMKLTTEKHADALLKIMKDLSRQL